MRTRFLHLILILFIVPATLLAQSNPAVDRIESSVSQSDVEMKIRFLAADEFMGRDIGTPHIDIAARYIATWFMTNGIRPLPGHESYFQEIPFIRVEAPDSGRFTVADSTFQFPNDFIAISPERGEASGALKFLEYASEEELEEVNLEGKIVITRPGLEGETSPQQWFVRSDQKRKAVAERGAVALIELYDTPMLPWDLIVQYLNQSWVEEDESLEQDENRILHLWLNATGKELASYFSAVSGEQADLLVEGSEADRFISKNVLGYIEGADPERKEEYIMLGAHYDHIGIDSNPDGENYIYNGARDNAVGTAGVLLAGRYLANNPPSRSVILAAWTAEEVGLLGSNHFAENPMVPLEQIIYKLNIDGAGYNDTSKVMVIGLERTDAEEDLRLAAAAFGLEAIPDPVPEQNLFDRSDNVNFARMGIPAPTYSLGLTAFDEEIERYYHTVEDEPDTIDYPYVTRYIRSFLLAAERIANADPAPFWREGDIYKEAGRVLYGR